MGLLQGVEFVGGVERQGGELAQGGGVELRVRRPHAHVPLDLAVGILPAAYDKFDACGGPAGASYVAAPGLAVAEFVDPGLDVLSVGGRGDASECGGGLCMASYLSCGLLAP